MRERHRRGRERRAHRTLDGGDSAHGAVGDSSAGQERDGLGKRVEVLARVGDLLRTLDARRHVKGMK